MTRSAAERLGRILHVLAVAERSGETTLEAIAAEVGIRRDDVLWDLTEVQNRSFYHPAGFEDDVQVIIENERVSVFTGRRFRRPPRLTSREAIALDLALRAAAVHDPERAERLDALARRVRPVLYGGSASERIDPAPADSGDAIARLLTSAAREQRRAVLRYARPGDPAPVERIVRPYAMVHAEGVGYVLAHCERAEAIRSFRLDRIVACELADGAFEIPAGFSVEDHVSGGRVFVPPADAMEVEVRYSADIARWISEREETVREEPGGSVVVRHRVADPDWMIRHVLQYGPDAEILVPPEMRHRMRECPALARYGAQEESGHSGSPGTPRV